LSRPTTDDRPKSKHRRTSDLPGVADLRQGGILSQRLPGYQERPSQIEMATLVAEGLSQEKHALLEAPTGVGKSLAYLIPLVRSGKVAIVSTANKALQEQLYYKDIPFVQEHLQHFEAALVKGIANYVCLDRLATERTEGTLDTQRWECRRLCEVIADPVRTFPGDFDTLGFQLPGDLRGSICADTDLCAWSKCPCFGECYVRQMREQAQRARVIVVNHTLLLLDVLAEGAILPSRDVIVLDEAHHLEEEATRAFTRTVAYSHVTRLLARKTLRAHTPVKLQEEVLRQAGEVWQQLEERLPITAVNKAPLHWPIQGGLSLAASLTDLAEALRQQPPLSQTEKEEVLYQKLIQSAYNLAERVRMIGTVDRPEQYVYYLERVTPTSNRAPYIEVSAAPLDVAAWLQEKLFDRWPTVCVSATLATTGPHPLKPGGPGSHFAYFKKRVGLEQHETLERILPPTFDYRCHALLYTPRDLPEPSYGNTQTAQGYMRAVAQRMLQLVKVSRGRAFLLFAGQRMLDQVYGEISAHIPYLLLRQGDLPRAELVRQFKEAGNAVLFGVKTFWEGVDVPGQALSLVVIDRLPFEPPDDPVHQARVARMKARGENWFREYVLPQVILQLKQGVGRLLRADDDRGVMAILDARLHTRGYGKSVLRTLPPAPLVTSFEEVERFFGTW
jgi:Rad3-related DNA helicase